MVRLARLRTSKPALVIVCTNMGRHEAFRKMIAHGFRTDFQGVTMHKPNEPGYSRAEVYLIDDWR